MVYLSLTLNRLHNCSGASIFNFEQVNAGLETVTSRSFLATGSSFHKYLNIRFIISSMVTFTNGVLETDVFPLTLMTFPVVSSSFTMQDGVKQYPLDIFEKVIHEFNIKLSKL